ncbi:MAG: alpha/beta fold hydrolase [Caulobacterales bacterium]|nr:alpha/beta fold hydrolase [Caulobacterales bacterium]
MVEPRASDGADVKATKSAPDVSRRELLGAAPFALAVAAPRSLDSPSGDPGLDRREFTTWTADGQSIFVREVRPRRAARGPILLLHGARVPGLASFDLPVPGGSLAEDLARLTGRPVYVMDARGYGRSGRPPALSENPTANPPQARAFQVVRDVGAVVEAAKRRSGQPDVALLGWATGGMWAAFYASLEPENVRHLVTLNALYGGSDKHPMLGPGSATSDPHDPDRLNPSIGAYTWYDAASLFPGWDRSIPIADKSAWRDPHIAEAYAQAALASDPQSAQSSPPRFRAPLGAIEDSFYQACGRRLFDAGSIRARTLVLRSELDFWSRPEDAAAFQRDAVHAADLQSVVLAGATHFAHLDRPPHGRDELLRRVAQHLATA